MQGEPQSVFIINLIYHSSITLIEMCCKRLKKPEKCGDEASMRVYMGSLSCLCIQHQ